MTNSLATVAQALVPGGRGILTIDQPAKTSNQRFAELGIAPTVEHRRAFRELLVTAPEIERYVSGAVLAQETLRQRTGGGQRFVELLRERGIVPGIAVDAGTAPLPFAPGETVTEGLDGLRGRLTEYAALGAGFATWRAPLRIGAGGSPPSERAIAANAHAMARFAALCQESGLLPVVQPEIIAEGSQDLARCADAGERVLRRVFAELAEAGVALEAMILETAMVAPGLAAAQDADTAAIVGATLRVLGATVPVAVAGIAFVFGGRDDRVATERLCALNSTMPRRRPWPLTFSYGRSLQYAALDAWRGRQDCVAEAQRIVVHRAYCNGLAACGAYSAKAEDRLATQPIPIAA